MLDNVSVSLYKVFVGFKAKINYMLFYVISVLLYFSDLNYNRVIHPQVLEQKPLDFLHQTVFSSLSYSVHIIVTVSIHGDE